jgi:transcriptional regulator with XRE-family HTH domain
MDLAGRLNISYQQLQKYETGQNRVSASRLYQIGRCLDVPLGYFFEGLGYFPSPAAPKDRAGKSADVGAGTMKMAQAFSLIPDPRTRTALLRLAKAIAPSRTGAD